MYLEQFKPGDKFYAPAVTITFGDIRDFALKYDPLPLHLDESHAESTPFGKVIAPGVMSFMLVWAEYVKLDIWNDSLVAGKSTKIEWHYPVFPGDELHSEAVVEDVSIRGDKNGTLTVRVYIYNQENVLCMTDTTEMVLARGQART